MRIAVVLGPDVDHLSRFIRHDLSLGHLQLQHAGLTPAALDETGQGLHVAQQGNDVRGQAAGVALQGRLDLLIRQAGRGFDYRIGEARGPDLAVFAVGQVHALGIARLARLERADSVAENLREHGQGAARQIDAVAAEACGPVQGRARRDEVTHVRDVHAEDPALLPVAREADGVVEILGVRRVDRDDQFFRDILAAACVLRIERRPRVGRLHEAGHVESIVQTMTLDDRGNLGIEPPRPAQDLRNHAPGRLGMRGVGANLDGDLVPVADAPGIDTFQLDGPQEIAAVRLDQPAGLLLAQRPDDRRMGPPEHLDNPAGDPVLLPPRVAAHDLRHDPVARHRAAGRLGRDEHVARIRKLLGRDEPVPARVGPEDARDLVGQRGQADDVPRPDNHPAPGAQRIERLAERRPQRAANTQFLLQVNDLSRRAVLLQQVQNMTFEDLVHHPIISPNPADCSHRIGGSLPAPRYVSRRIPRKALEPVIPTKAEGRVEEAGRE